MLTGPPKMLTSQFKLSYNLIISIISANKNDLLKNVNNGYQDFCLPYFEHLADFLLSS